MLNEHRRVKLVEFERLKEHPLSVAAPGSYTECDALASAPYDQTRPPGLTGVTQQELNTGAAIAACREELQKHPDSARSTFELARALLIDGRCDEGPLTNKEAILKGSAAAAVLYGLRRHLVDEARTFKQVIAPGERKSIQTDRIVLSPGPADEVDRPRDFSSLH